MPRRKILLGLAHFGALQVTDLDGEAFDRRRDQRQGHKELGMAVARDDLRRDRLGLETQFLCNVFLDPGIDIGECPDGARDRAGRDLLARRGEACAVARKLGVMPGEFQSEGRRLRVDAVAAAHRRCQFVLEGSALQHREQRIEIGQQNVGGLGQLHRKTGVEHVAGGHPLVHKACLRADMLGEVGQKGDHIVAGLALDLVDALGLEAAPLPHRASGALGDDPQRRLRVAGICLDLEPDPVTVLRRPDPGHLGATVARDHAVRTSSSPNCLSAATIWGGTGAMISSGGRAG